MTAASDKQDCAAGNGRRVTMLSVVLPVSSKMVLGLPAGVTRMRYVPGVTVTYADAEPNDSDGTTGVADERSAVADVT